jgi:hypothetical protein
MSSLFCMQFLELKYMFRIAVDVSMGRRLAVMNLVSSTQGRGVCPVEGWCVF